MEDIKIILGNSEIIPVGEVEYINVLTNILCCKDKTIHGWCVEEHKSRMGMEQINISYVVGGSARVKLWHDIQRSNYALKELYPYSYSTSGDRDASVYSSLVKQVGEGPSQ